jgi:hypothetical protein
LLLEVAVEAAHSALAVVVADTDQVLLVKTLVGELRQKADLLQQLLQTTASQSELAVMVDLTQPFKEALALTQVLRDSLH